MSTFVGAGTRSVIRGSKMKKPIQSMRPSTSHLVRLRCRTFLLATLLTVTTASLNAQQASVTRLSGIVMETAGEPVPQVQILLDETELVALSDPSGYFHVDGVVPGTHTLTLSRPGFEVRTYRFTLPEQQGSEIDLGVILLERQRDSFAILTGTVVDSMSVEPVAAVQLKLDDQVVGISDPDGGFRLNQVRAGFHTLEARRIGYGPTFVDFEVLPGRERVNLIVKMKALPTELAAVTIEGRETIYAKGKLREFYERAQSGFGQFIMRSEIEQRSARVTTDLLYGTPGLQVTPGPSGRNTVRLSRVTLGCQSPVVFLDGVKIYGADLDQVVNPGDVMGIEVYTRASNLPAVFSAQGAAACGVIAVWTR